MGTAIGVIVGVVVVLLLAGLVMLLLKRRAQRRQELQEMYGPEYDRAVQETGSRAKAERELAARHDQRSQLEIRPLDPSSRQRYQQSWQQVQARFVDDPQQSVSDADDLVTAVMRERGYPTDGFEEQARLLSVDHANTLDNYRQGHHIAGLAKQRQATTEQLRQGMMHYRSLFTDLVEHGGAAPGQEQYQGQAASRQEQPAEQFQPTREYQRPAQHQPEQHHQSEQHHLQPEHQHHQQVVGQQHHQPAQPAAQQYQQPAQPAAQQFSGQQYSGEQYAQPAQQPQQPAGQQYQGQQFSGQQYAQPAPPPSGGPMEETTAAWQRPGSPQQPMQSQPMQSQPPSAPPVMPGETQDPSQQPMGYPQGQHGQPYPPEGYPQDDPGSGLRRRTSSGPEQQPPR